ncbi:glycosyltransferase family 4 protein [uncultured Chitinophaga sp.]|jgi:Glycosyltransferase|uniref:glycosyltransferase family 4 protein n=1 Tax=uncultured Chitinophaga sp. TaxID=339340 RepID=UPI00262A6711|nr:glycosyltransferase family 4 protein [uncultured Chitinophaga sp.]
MKKGGHILFIGHEASLSGAPILLLNLLLLLQHHRSIKVTLVIRRGGPLSEEYAKYFPVIVLKPAGYREGGPLMKVAAILRNRWQLLRLMLIMPGCNYVFSNTIINGPLLKTIAFFRKPVITYVHELENVIRAYAAEVTQTLKYTHRFAYPSLRVKDALVTTCRLTDEKLQRLSYYFPVNLPAIHDEATKRAFTEDFRQRFKLEDSDMLIGGMGLASHRKGADIFVEVCGKVAAMNKRVKFCWIGDFDSAVTEAALKQQVQDLQIGNQIVFTGPLPHNYYNLAPFDLFFLSSREDPYPLVVLEAGFMRVPALCFENSGGIPEFVGEDAGWIVPDFSTALAAETILGLYDRREQLQQKGARAQQKSLQLHADPELILSQFDHLLT